jgi:hypothetical protein
MRYGWIECRERRSLEIPILHKKKHGQSLEIPILHEAYKKNM